MKLGDAASADARDKTASSISRDSGARHDPGATLKDAPPWRVEEDLHLHTTASDGAMSPAELVRFLAGTSIRRFSITDHDTTAGFDDAEREANRFVSLTFIPGIELSAQVRSQEIHLTCHFIDRDNADLQRQLSHLVSDRASKAQQIVERLGELGLPISWDSVVANAEGAIGRPHVARAMILAGYVDSVSEAFDRYLSPGKPAHLPRLKVEGRRALELVHGARGVATVAHPRTVADIEMVLDELAPLGLTGIEVYAEKYGPASIQRYSDLADRYGLVKSGGSDYHANDAENEVLPGMNGPPPGTCRALYARALSLHGRVGCAINEASL